MGSARVSHAQKISSFQISYENSFSQIGLQQKTLLFETDFSPAQSLFKGPRNSLGYRLGCTQTMLSLLGGQTLAFSFLGNWVKGLWNMDPLGPLYAIA